MQVPVKDLPSYAQTDTSVRFTLDGPVTANQTHNDVIIEVNNSMATLTVTKGYNNELVRTKNYLTGTALYEVFLRAINFAGFTKGKDNSPIADERGRCALGSRFIYEVVDGSGNVTSHYWRSTCGTGTFEGNFSQINTLFRNQIPDYSQLTQDSQVR